MANYHSDRNFTDYVHAHLARPIIYVKLGWRELNVPAHVLNQLDMNFGIDYVARNTAGRNVTIQERFRESKYSNYDDATLRFRRERNKNADRIESEFYKIKADYLVYGITDGDKNPEKRDQLKSLRKWVVLDLQFLQNKYQNGKLKIVDRTQNKCFVDEDILHCPENFNPDGSSSFIPLDVLFIHQLWGNAPILAQSGFIVD